MMPLTMMNVGEPVTIKKPVAGGLVQPTTSALIHNVSILAISLSSMKNLLE